MRLARSGLLVFPADWREHPKKKNSPRKSPLVNSWPSDATRDEIQIGKWWRAWPDALPAIPAGANKLLIIDCDKRPDCDGVAYFETLVAENGLPDPAPLVETISGGRHVYFKLPDSAPGNSPGALKDHGIDVRGAGGYVIAPGAVWNGGGWRKLPDSPGLDRAPDAPAWLLDILKNPVVHIPATEQKQRIARRHDLDCAQGDERRYIEDALSYVSSDGREEWLRIGMALHESGEAWAREVWDTWSRGSSKFDPREQDKAWRSYSRGYGGLKVTLGTVVDMARLSGFAGRKFEPERREYNGPMIAPTKSPRIKALAKSPETPPWLRDRKAPTLDTSPIEAILARKGLVSQIANWILSVARRPQKSLAVAAALSAVGTVASRQLVTPTRANVVLYLMMVAETGFGKDAPLKGLKTILKESGLAELIGPEGISSDVGLYDYAARQPVCCVTIDEFGEIFAANKSNNAAPHTLKISAAWRRLYGGGIVTTPHAATRPSVALDNPCVSLLAASTPGQFYDSIGVAELLNGFVNRFLLFSAPRAAKRHPTPGDEKRPPKALTEGLKALADRPGGSNFSRFRSQGTAQSDCDPEIVNWTKDAEAAWLSYEDECLERIETDKAAKALAARCAENAIRAATVLAIGENLEEPIIEKEHIEIGKSLAEASFKALISGINSHVPGSSGFDIDDKIEAKIDENGGEISRRDLYASVRRAFRNSRSFDEKMLELQEAGIIEIALLQQERGGHPQRFYKLIRRS